MLISAVHKFPFKMSPLLHFLLDPSILWLEGLVVNPTGCHLVCGPWGTAHPWIATDISSGRKWVRGEVSKMLNKKKKTQITLQKFFSDIQKDFSSLSREA